MRESTVDYANRFTKKKSEMTSSNKVITVPPLPEIQCFQF